MKVSDLKPLEKNPFKSKGDEQIKRIAKSIQEFERMMEIRRIVIDEENNILGGNKRYFALKKLGYKEIPDAWIEKVEGLTEEQKKEFIVKDNAHWGSEWDYKLLEEWKVDLNEWGVGDVNFNYKKNINDEQFRKLSERFIVPPFSIFDTRKGYWQERKKIWMEVIGDLGESRNDALYDSIQIKYKELYVKTQQHREELGISFKEYLDRYVPDYIKDNEEQKILSAGVSILDPVLAEIVCRWFGLDNCKTFDCFAGDSVFGYVSSYLGNEFIGIELREEQVKINNERVAGMKARYVCDDGQNVAKYIEPNSQDLFFCCPPYFDLEHYSELPNDASNQGSYDDFIKILRNAFTASITCLKENKFAVIVVSDIRDKQSGFYYDFCGDIKRIFKDNGMGLYNEIILINTGASTALRAARYMNSRKVAKMHQNVLVFYKGDTDNIKKNFKKIEYASEDLELFRLDSGNEPTKN